jgi:hypothetical protein
MCLDFKITKDELSKTELKNLNSGIAYKVVAVKNKQYYPLYKNRIPFSIKNNIANNIRINMLYCYHNSEYNSYMSGFHAFLSKTTAIKYSNLMLGGETLKVIKIKFDPKKEYTLGAQNMCHSIVVDKFDIVGKEKLCV